MAHELVLAGGQFLTTQCFHGAAGVFSNMVAGLHWTSDRRCILQLFVFRLSLGCHTASFV